MEQLTKVEPLSKAENQGLQKQLVAMKLPVQGVVFIIHSILLIQYNNVCIMYMCGYVSLSVLYLYACVYNVCIILCIIIMYACCKIWLE